MWVAGEDKVADAERLIFADAFRYLLRITYQRGTRAAAHQSDAGPQIGRNAQIIARSLMQGAHPRLAGRVHAGEDLLRLGNGIVVKMGDQPVGGGPCLFFRFAHNDVQTNAVLQGASAGRGALAHHRQLLRHQFRGFAPRQIAVDLLGRHINGRIRRAAEIERRAILLHRREQHLSAFHVNMLAVIIHFFPAQQAGVNIKKFAGHLIALAVAEEDTVAFVFHRVAAGNDVDQQPTFR
ncbi:Uncharacterised protein [Klebsiella pneumoniae]|nr:Uncharacterised protein [Klebsiella pneumoniae]